MFPYHVLLFLFLLVIPSSLAHMYLSSLTVGGQKLAEGDCVRIIKGRGRNDYNSPIMPVTSNEMTCGLKPAADQAANRKCPVAAGSKVGMQWYHNEVSAGDDIVDGSHRGPCTVYMAKDNNDGKPAWFKIWQSGYDASTNKFCVDTLIANRGYMEFTIPADIAPGNYLLRGEAIALHESYKTDGAQFYIGCAEVTVSGNGKASPATVTLPGAYKNTDPGLLIPNFYSGANFAQYVVPGPAVYTAGSAPAPPAKGGDGENGPQGGPEGPDGDSGGVSSGVVAAIVVIMVVCVGLLAGTAFYYYKKGHLFGYSIPPNKFFNSKNSSGDRKQSSKYVAFQEEL